MQHSTPHTAISTDSNSLCHQVQLSSAGVHRFCRNANADFKAPDHTITYVVHTTACPRIFHLWQFLFFFKVVQGVIKQFFLFIFDLEFLFFSPCHKAEVLLMIAKTLDVSNEISNPS